MSVRQLRGLGYGRQALAHAVGAGRLHRIHRGVYAVGHRHLDTHGRLLAAVLTCEPGAVVSHQTAAWVWGLVRSAEGDIHVTAPTRRHARRSLRLHYAPLTDEDRAVCDGIPVTAVARTLLDLAAARPRSLDPAIERAEQLGLLDLVAIDSVVSRVAGHRGARRLRRAVALYRPDSRFTRSDLERRFLELVRDAALPLPATNTFVAGHELDAYWEEERFAVELDTYAFHGSRAAFERDRVRHEDLALAGIEMIRVTGHRIDTEPLRVAERLAQHLKRRRPAG